MAQTEFQRGMLAAAKIADMFAVENMQIANDLALQISSVNNNMFIAKHCGSVNASALIAKTIREEMLK